MREPNPEAADRGPLLPPWTRAPCVSCGYEYQATRTAAGYAGRCDFCEGYERGSADERLAASKAKDPAASVPEPAPKPGGEPVTPSLLRWLRENGHDVAADVVAARDAFGRAKYGQGLCVDDGRDHVEDARQELGDALQYIHAAALAGKDVRPLGPLVDALVELLAAWAPTWCPDCGDRGVYRGKLCGCTKAAPAPAPRLPVVRVYSGESTRGVVVQEMRDGLEGVACVEEVGVAEDLDPNPVAMVHVDVHRVVVVPRHPLQPFGVPCSPSLEIDAVLVWRLRQLVEAS